MKIGRICEKHAELRGVRYEGGKCPGCVKARRLAHPQKTVVANAATRAANRKHYAKHPERARARRLKLAGFTVSSFRMALERQAHLCAVCGTDLLTLPAKATHADHDHATGWARGVLCRSCNVGLGSFKDNPEWLINAAMYLINPTLPGAKA